MKYLFLVILLGLNLILQIGIIQVLGIKLQPIVVEQKIEKGDEPSPQPDNDDDIVKFDQLEPFPV